MIRTGDATTRRAAIGAWAACAFSGLLLVVGFAIDPHRDYGGAVVGGANSVVTALSFLTFSVVGAFIVARRGHHPVGWLFCVSGMGFAALSLAEAYVRYTRVFALGDLPGERVLVWMSSWMEFVAFTAAPILMLFVFPTGRVLSPRWRYAVAATIVAACIAIIGTALAPGPFEDYRSVANPFGLDAPAETLLMVMSEVGWPLLLAGLVSAAVSLLLRFRKAHGRERDQIKWMLFGGVVLVLFFGFFGITAALGNDQIAESLLGVSLAILPAAAGIAIVKHRLYDIDVVINRTLVYGALTALLALFYVGSVFVFQRVLGPLTAESDLAIAGSTLAVAALFRPLRTRVQGFIDLRFYRSKYDAHRTLEIFTERLRDEIDLDALAGELVGVAGRTVHPAHASLWLRGAAGGSR